MMMQTYLAILSDFISILQIIEGDLVNKLNLRKEFTRFDESHRIHYAGQSVFHRLIREKNICKIWCKIDPQNRELENYIKRKQMSVHIHDIIMKSLTRAFYPIADLIKWHQSHLWELEFNQTTPPPLQITILTLGSNRHDGPNGKRYKSVVNLLRFLLLKFIVIGLAHLHQPSNKPN